MEESTSPLVDSVSGLVAEERAGGHLYSQPGPTGFGNAAGLTELGAWVLTTEESTALRNLVKCLVVVVPPLAIITLITLHRPILRPCFASAADGEPLNFI